LDATVKENIDAALKRAKEALEGQDADAMRGAGEQLAQASHKLAEAVYAKASQQQSAQQQGSEKQDGEGPAGGEKRKREDVVDADFEEVKD
jgi:molecular chaperone DnaK